jgi:dTDP-4-amino-4,6-dideoxygalactose transaminase
MIIQYNRPDLNSQDFLYFLKGYFMDFTKPIEDFFSKLTGKKYCLYISSARMGLDLLFNFLDLPGEVISSPLICKIPLLELLKNSVKIKFCDCDLKTFNLSITSLEKCINKNTSAVIVYHLGGNPEEMDKICKIVKNNNLILIEDCAQAFGARYKGKHIGSFGDIAIFSFMKNIQGIAGGLIGTNNYDLFLKIKNSYNKYPIVSLNFYSFIRLIFEQKRSNYYYSQVFSAFTKFKKKHVYEKDNFDLRKIANIITGKYYRKPSMNMAAVSFSQIVKRNIILPRQKNALILRNLLSGIRSLSLQEITNDCIPSFTKIFLRSENRASDIIPKLRALGIEANHLYFSEDGSIQLKFDKDNLFNKNNSIYECTNYLSIHDHILCLPISSNLAMEEIRYIYKAITSIMG